MKVKSAPFPHLLVRLWDLSAPSSNPLYLNAPQLGRALAGIVYLTNR